jgi:hypothetical protein
MAVQKCAGRCDNLLLGAPCIGDNGIGVELPSHGLKHRFRRAEWRCNDHHVCASNSATNICIEFVDNAERHCLLQAFPIPGAADYVLTRLGSFKCTRQRAADEADPDDGESLD